MQRKDGGNFSVGLAFLRAVAALFLLLACDALSACGDIQEKIGLGKDPGQVEPMEQRRQLCAKMQGTFSDVEVGACVDGQAVLKAGNEQQSQPCIGGEESKYEGQCLLRDANGLIYFCDGPSVPESLLNTGKDWGEGTDLYAWNEFFWDTGVNHDYCYHNGRAVYGYTQEDCDAQMLDDLVALCSLPPDPAKPWFTKDRCTTNAQIMYAAVRGFGGANFNRVATHVTYPAYVPMWKTIGLPQKPDDPELRDAIDTVL